MSRKTENAPEPEPVGSAFNEKEQRLLRTLGKDLRRLRKERGIGVRQIARDLDVSPSLISHIELGRGAPSVKTLYALANALNVPMSELFGRASIEEADESSLVVRQDGDASSNVIEIADQIRTQSAAAGEESEFVQRGSCRKAIQLEHGFRWERLSPGTEPNVEFIESIIAPGGGDPQAELKTHNGKEYGLVLEGRLGVKIGFQEFILGPRDSIVFDSTLPHSMWNAGSEPVRTIWFVNRQAANTPN